MNEIKIYEKLTYIETYDGDIKTTAEPIEKLNRLLKDEKFLNLGDELLNVSNIKRVFTKELTEVDKVLYSLDKGLRKRVEAEIAQRDKKGLNTNVEVLSNIIQRLGQINI